jgi:hypothetical protein
MKSLAYAVKFSTRAELLNHIMAASAHIMDDQPSCSRSVTSISQRATLCIDNHREVISSTYFTSISIINS